MRSPAWLCALFISAFSLGIHQQARDPCFGSQPDLYPVKQVRIVFQTSGTQLGISWIDKRIWPLGDGVSVAVMKIMDANKLIEPENCTIYLRLVRLAFSLPRAITREENKDPNVTLFLLAYLKEKESQNAALEKEIEFTELYVKNQTATVQPTPQDH